MYVGKLHAALLAIQEEHRNSPGQIYFPVGEEAFQRYRGA